MLGTILTMFIFIFILCLCGGVVLGKLMWAPPAEGVK